MKLTWKNDKAFFIGMGCLALLVALSFLLEANRQKKERYTGRIVNVDMGKMRLFSMGNMYHIDRNGDGIADRVEWIRQDEDILSIGDSILVKPKFFLTAKKIHKIEK